ncbi:MAG TPA: ABC transporter substrate-binding protein [Solirubrobacterales bacterium]|nr:ABC transporter substrate-binding protein [Solirubrobacterales bacterium]
MALLLLSAGCGGSSDGSAAPESAAGDGFPVTVEDATRSVTVERRPERIVSLSPSATETLFALGAGAQVIAVDEESDYPPEVPRTDLSSYQPNVEAIVGYDPDLVVLPASVPRDVSAGLRRVGLTVLAEPAPANLDDAYAQFGELGVATGHAAAGRRLAGEVRAEVEGEIEAAPSGRGLDFFHELDPDLYTVGNRNFIGRIYQQLGLRNVGEPAARRAGTPYPQMSSEAVVGADPDLIVLADTECCGQSPAKVAQRPGWDDVAAVRNGVVVAISDDIASRWGPRIPVFVARVVAAMERAREAAGEAG